MNFLILFFKGIIIGIGKIIPGVSGSLLAISLGVYEKSIEYITNFFQRKREALSYLLPLAGGIFLAILFGSNLMLQLLKNYYVFTVAIFIGLILGTVHPFIQKEGLKKWDFLILFSIVFFLFFLEKKLSLPNFIPTNSFTSLVSIFFMGVIDAITTILPGISGTATFMMLGCYTFVLELFSNPFQNIFYCILFGSGMLISLIGMVYIVRYLFQHHHHTTWVFILGFLFSSIISLALRIIDLIDHTNLLSILFLGFLGFSMIRLFSNED